MTTSPFEAKSWPKDPTLPTAAPVGYTTPTQPAISAVEPPRTPAEIESLRGQWYELILRQIFQAFTGFFFPGSGRAFDQLTGLADNIPFVGPFLRAGNELWNRLFDLFTGGVGSTGKTLNDSVSAGQTTLTAIAGIDMSTGAPGSRPGDDNALAQAAWDRLYALQPNTGAVKGGMVAGSVPLGSATAVAGSAVGGKGGMAGNALVNPTFDEYALQPNNNWSLSPGAGALA